MELSGEKLNFSHQSYGTESGIKGAASVNFAGYEMHVLPEALELSWLFPISLIFHFTVMQLDNLVIQA